MKESTSFYVVNFLDLCEAIASKNFELERLLKKNYETENSLRDLVLHALIYGDFQNLQRLFDEQPTIVHTHIHDIYENMVALFGRKLDAGKGFIGYRSLEGVDVVLEEKSYPSSFSIDSLFRTRQIPCYGHSIPTFKEISLGCSFIHPGDVERARKVAQSLSWSSSARESHPKRTKREPTPPHKLAGLLKERRRRHLLQCELKIRRKWLLDKRNIYNCPRSHEHRAWKEIWLGSAPSPVIADPYDSICHWDRLPMEIQEFIIQEIEDVRTLCRLSQVSKKFFNMIITNPEADEKFWLKHRKNVGIVAFFR